MNLKNVLFAVTFICSSIIVAHEHHDATREALLNVVEKFERKNNNLETQNANLRAQVASLQETLKELKHHLPAKHPFHGLVKALIHLENEIN